MRTFVIGATGRTGRLVVATALARGHTVTALVRNPAALDRREGLRIERGDPTQASHLASAMAGQEAIVSCLGQTERGDARLLRDAAAACIAAMRDVGTCRYLVVSQGLLFTSSNPLIHLLRIALKRHVADSEAMEVAVRTGADRWTIVRPPRLTNGATPRGYRVTVDARPAGPASMRRIDLAAFLVDEAESAALVGAVVGITSGRQTGQDGPSVARAPL